MPAFVKTTAGKGVWLSSPLARSRLKAGKLNDLLIYFDYILHSEKFSRYYVGHCKNCESRLLDHNRGKVKSTKAYVPWSIIYTDQFQTKSEAFRREMEIKSYKGGEAFRKLVHK
ncbi:MAG: GIY-YIG nuclease family protein [Melioribacteraceae bacterium]|nr:GIY-YIG nuclease family protein [Melioribacteraceae bacterium]